ncbi:rod-determining factor RdfA [Halorussus salinus]|uniref:rod-determining factor RdfA n=1 Tax=Halorussus salinus TaxID=1364935 RepID=UPI0010928FD3|nr:rod-determining factor RdfA [Halorussus salinus]
MTSEQVDCSCKVGRVAEEYGVTEITARLVDDWQAGTSVRELADELNESVVRSALTAANVGQVEWSRTPVYEALHTDELSDAQEVQIRRELDRAGVDVDELSSALVSHQTVYRHLKNCLDASKGDTRSPKERRKKAKDTVYALQRRTEVVTESTLETLDSADVTDLGDIDVLVDLRVVCNDCGRSMNFEDAMNEGCDCAVA